MIRLMMVAGLAVAAASLSAAENGPAAVKPAEVTEAMEMTTAEGGVFRYRWHAPAKLEDGKLYPLVVLLHGAGERGTNNVDQLRHGAGSLLNYAIREAGDCFFIAGQVPAGRRWVEVDWGRLDHRMPEKPSVTMAALIALIEKTIAESPVDRDRVYATGISMGGYGTWDLVSRRTELFAAAMPVCGGADVRQAWKLRKLPIWVCHGDQDTIVPFDRSRRMVAALWEVDGNVRYSEYPGVSHAVWGPAYADKAHLKWLFAQKRVPAKRLVEFKDGEKIAFLGDSITEFGSVGKDGKPNPTGYVNLVIDGIRAAGVNVEPIYAGIRGNTSKDMLARVKADVFDRKPDWMFLSCGVNDAPNGLDNPGIPLEEYRRNIDRIIGGAKKLGIKVIALEPTPVLEEPHIANENERAYVDAFREQGRRCAALVPVNRAFTAAIRGKVDPKTRVYTVDGTHLSETGNRLMAATILDTLGYVR